MKLFLLCTLAAFLGLVRGLDVKCEPHESDDSDSDDETSCVITGPVTVKTGEKVNIVSDVSLNSIDTVKFGTIVSPSEISTVPTEIFEQLPNLTNFELYATVEVLNKEDFEKAGKLKSLAIDSLIKKIPAGVLASAKNLERLTLSRNQIAEIEDNAFSSLTALLSINLAINKLTIIKQNTFNGLEKLETLYLESNQIELIEENALNLPNLKQFAIYNNKLTHFHNNLFSAAPLLKSLDAQINQINNLGKSLYGLKSLEILYLSQNNLTDIDFVAFSKMSALIYLDLSENRLTSDNINKIEIKEPSKSVLSYLSLEHNELTNSEDWKKFAIFPQLESINVQNNKYSKIDVGDKTLRQQFLKLQTLYVSSGKWSCDWLKDFVESAEKDGIYIGKKNPFSSTDGNEVKGIGCV